MQTYPSLRSLGSILFFLVFLSILAPSVRRNFKKKGGLGWKSLDNLAPEAGNLGA